LAGSTGIEGLASVAACVAEPARARMLAALLSGLALTATELAAEAEVAPSTASAHLAKLLEGGLVTLERQGRHRYYRLASADVAALLEGLAGVAVMAPGPRRYGPALPELRAARVCYDHLAGERAVRLFDRLVSGGALTVGAGGCVVTAAGEPLFLGLGIDVAALRKGRRLLARPCLDWSERRPHLAGALGAALLARLFELGWAAREADGRVVRITPRGDAGLAEIFARSARTPG
jgi:DNA-binding transcriptional ArsR family regulator